MRVVNTGNIYKIYDNSLVTLNQLPSKNYAIRFSNNSGFYLEDYSDIEVNEKVYGVHESKVNKVIRSFNQMHKNLGVILSGDKGIGKSLFAKMLSVKAVESGIPVVIVDRYIPGIAAYINSIEQEIMVLFDEFDKTFEDSDDEDPQAEMLTLFDGLAQGKKLFVITCNSLRNLNSYLINRPGRFHYHFRFTYPDENNIKEYLSDRVEEKFHKEIAKVVEFSKKVDLNYDCLRSIAFELNTGETFEEAIKDLNIVNTNSIPYKIALHFTNGATLKVKNSRDLDLFSDDSEENVYLLDLSGNYIASVSFNVADVEYSSNFSIYVPANKLNIRWEEEYEDDDKEKGLVKSYKELTPDYLSLTKVREKGIHYTV